MRWRTIPENVQSVNNIFGRATFNDNSSLEPPPSLMIDVHDVSVDDDLIDNNLFKGNTEGEEDDDYDQENITMAQRVGAL